jgi:uncharacterized protein YndB with AHSA1/START domain
MTTKFDAIADTHRELRRGAGGDALVIRRRFDTDPEDAWDAVTRPERLARWFLPVTGDLRPGGRYSLEGNASGEIRRCERPHEIVLSWEFCGAVSEVVVRLRGEDGGTVLELVQTPVAAELIPNASPQLWGLGSGWEMGLNALGHLLAGTLPPGPAKDWIASAPPEALMEAAAQSERISQAWRSVITAG